jgi:Leucine-rich repeat (LRR) protein
MTNLEELNLSNNQLTGAIQSQIGQLKKLKVLKAGNNLMTGVPAEVGQLTNLQVLDLSNNQLTGLPNELGNLKNLQTFNISGNDYSSQDLNGIVQKLPASVNIIK